LTVLAANLPGMGATAAVREWILDSDEPWTRFRFLAEVEPQANAREIEAAREEMVAHPAVRGLVARVAEWPGYPLRRHNDAGHPLYGLSTLADLGLRQQDPGIAEVVSAVTEHFDGEGFETLLWFPKFLTKEPDTQGWGWMLCDAPTLLYALLAFGVRSPAVDAAVATLLRKVDDHGWRCGAASSLPRFSGPGRKNDPCPLATIAALKVLSLLPEHHDSQAVAAGLEAVLGHWEDQRAYKLKMFGIGTDFRKLKYPFIWYDILHVADILSRFGRARGDRRLAGMVGEIAAQSDGDGRYRAGSMYQAWKGWSFADKKHPSPWLTAMVLRVQARLEEHAVT
jgi:hypothetical protein